MDRGVDSARIGSALMSDVFVLQPNECMSALSELRGIVLESDISPFEVNHSGLVRAFLHFLAGEGMAERHRAQNLRCFLHIYANLPVSACHHVT